MSSIYRMIRIIISLANIVVAAIIVTSIWPFVTGDFSVDLPNQSEVDWSYSNGIATISAPVSIHNGGFYDIEDVKIFITVTNSTEFEIINSTDDWGIIRASSNFHETVEFSIDLGKMLSSGSAWMIFHPDFFDVHLLITCKYTWKLIGFSADYAIPINWDGLIRDIGFGTPTLDNSTLGHLRVIQPYYIWTNSLLAGFNGNFSAVLRNATNSNLIASSSDDIDLGINYSGELVFEVNVSQYLSLFLNNQTIEATISINMTGLPPIVEVRSIQWIAPSKMV